MRRHQLRYLAVAASFFFFSGSLIAQNGFSFHCTRDTILAGCDPTPCITLKTVIPDIRSISSSYSLNPIPIYNSGCFPVYSNPDIPGNPTNLTIDDRYSAAINLGFNFPFFGTPYSQVVASTNGVVSFDIAKAGMFAHWNIINGGTPQNLPSTFYDRALIMGPYHDLNPNVPQPTQRIQYTTVGAAPHRKWILSFFKVPLFGSGCGSLFENTHQIVLYESTGMIEVLIFSKQICLGWNQGRAMVGIQNYDRDAGMMAPGRNATDPPWGSLNMNESWRFVPNGGPSLFRRVELYNPAGTLLATGTASPVGNGNLEASFPNICPPVGTTTYIVKSFYTKIDDPNVEIFGADTIRVTKSPPTDLNASATSTPSNCGPPTGSITVTVPSGTPPFTYVLDGGAPQVGPSPRTFNNIAAGIHTILVTDASGICNSTVTSTVTQNSNLSATLTPAATSCPGVNNGTLNVTPSNGTGPFTFVLNPGNIISTGATATFTGLAAGNYSVTITDAAGCATVPAITTSITSGPGLSASAASSATACLGGSSGTITVTPISGTPPYTFVLDGTVTQTGNVTTFTGVPAGMHTVTVTDANGCTRSPALSVTVAPGPPLVTSATHTDVLCNSGATGSITVNQPPIGTPPFEYSLDGVTWQSSNIFTGLPSRSYTVYYRESGGCMGQLTQTVGEPPVLTAAVSSLAATCNGQSNGSVTIVPTGGVAPYEYSINGGVNWQSSNTFNAGAGIHTITIRDANLCTFSQTVTVTEPAAMTASAVTSNATCNGGNDGTITLSASGGNTSYEFSLDGNSFQPSNIFNTAPGTYTATIRDNLGCTVTVPNIVVDLTNDLTFTPPVAPTICEGSSIQLGITSNALQYSWTPTTGLNNSYSYNPVANPTVTTTYTVTLTYGRCSTDVPFTVNVNAAPLPDAGPDGYICYGQNYQLQGAGGTQFTWTPSTNLDNPGISNPVATPDRTTTYSLSVVDANGCPSLVPDEMKVDVTPPIKVSTFPFDTVAYEGDQFQLLATSVATDYSWTPSTGLSNPGIPNPVLTAGAVGDVIVYKVTASTQAGCKGEGYVRLRVYKGPDLYVPTGFTPNGDGKNDTFFPFPVGVKSIRYFRIFNRWGQLLFSTSTLNHGWDGKFGGVEQANGVYVWMVEGFTKDDRPITRKGTIMLIR